MQVQAAAALCRTGARGAAHRCGVSALAACSCRRAAEWREEAPAECGVAPAVALEDTGVAVVDTTLRRRPRQVVQVQLMRNHTHV